MEKAQPAWLDRVRTTNRFHITKIKENKDWRLQDTAKELKKSIGSVSQELMVYKWLRTHEYKLTRFKYLHQAVEFIRDRKHELLMED